MAEFLSVCLQIANDHVALFTHKNDTKLNVVVENEESIATSLKSVVKKCPSLKVFINALPKICVKCTLLHIKTDFIGAKSALK